MANFDPNIWYQMTTKAFASSAVVGTSLFKEGKGAVFVEPPNATHPGQHWQFFPITTDGPSTSTKNYVLRCKDGGPGGYMQAGVKTGDINDINDTLTPGGTSVLMRNSTLSRETSIYWQSNPWSDGTFFLTNSANGSAWHFEVNKGFGMQMGSNITYPQQRQSFSFNALGRINDVRYSSIDTFTLVAATTTSTVAGTTLGQSATTPTTTTTSLQPSNTTVSENKSHSNAGAIGGAVGGAVAFLILLALGLILFRRRRRKQKSTKFTGENDAFINQTQKQPGFYENSTNQVSELPGFGRAPSSRVTELPGSPRNQISELADSRDISKNQVSDMPYSSGNYMTPVSELPVVGR